jgi:carboxyl-terminal processing protease
MQFAPAEDTRKQLIESVVAMFERRFYDPRLHGVALRELVKERYSELLRTTAFSYEMNAVISAVKAYPIEFFHESERRVALWKTIKATFHPWDGRWMFQDVLTAGFADRAGIRPGAVLLAIDGREVDASDIPKFAMSSEVTVAFENPGQAPETFTFNPCSDREKEDDAQCMTHALLRPEIGYVRATKFPGVLGIGIARVTDRAICALNRPRVLIIDMRGNLGSVGAGNLRLMGYFTPDRIPVGYSLTRARAEQGYRREDLVRFTQIPRSEVLAPFTLLKFKDVDKSIVVVTEGLGEQSFHGRIIMLVNEHTVSGGEIVAGFASDHKFATLIGTSTSGRLLAWSTLSVGHDCFLTLPTGNYLTWEGKSFEGMGVAPDRVVPFSPEATRNGIDVQLDSALDMALHF